MQGQSLVLAWATLPALTPTRGAGVPLHPLNPGMELGHEGWHSPQLGWGLTLLSWAASPAPASPLCVLAPLAEVPGRVPQQGPF